MKVKNFTLLAKLKEQLKEQLKKAKADKEKFENERKKQEYHLELESECLEMQVQLLQGRIDNLNVEGLEERVPKYFKIRPRHENVVMDICKTWCVDYDGSAIFLKVDKVVLYQNVDLGETEFTYSRGIKLFVACSINEALNVFNTNYIEITEDEYNKLKKQAIETITDNEINEKI